MRRYGWVKRGVFAVLLMWCGTVVAAESELPAFGGKKAVAVVNGEPITLGEFRRALDSLHSGAGENMSGGGRRYSELIDRLINGKLILQEARNIGLNTLPEVRENVKLYERQTMRLILLSRQVKSTRPNEGQVERIYKESIREVKIRSFLFTKEEDAQQAAEEIRSGSDFDNVMRRMVSEGKARGSEEGGYIKRKELLPEISEAVSKLKAGGVSPVKKVSSGGKGDAAYTILKLDEVRFPENAEAKEQARREVHKEQRLEAIKKYVETLKNKYVKINKKTLGSLDYEAKEPGLEKLLADQRVVVKVQGEKPIRVKDLSLSLEKKFYHGISQETSSKKVNKHVPEVLNEMVTTKVLEKEALLKKIDKTRECREKIKEFEDEILFGMFVGKAINPDIKVDDGVVRRYYDDHPMEFSAPETIRGEDLAFANREDASDALEKLRRGADFKWVSANAPGQVEERTRDRFFPVEGGSVLLDEVAESAKEAVSGAGTGEYRLYESPKGQFLVLHIVEAVPPRPYPFETVKGRIGEKMFREEQQRSVEEWVRKLRAASEIKVFATDKILEKIFVPVGGKGGNP